MTTIKKPFFVFFTLLLAMQIDAKNCFIAAENNQIIYQEGECEKRYPPCSTFKIAISLMGFDAGILTDEYHPMWDFMTGYVDWLSTWQQPHNPQKWLANSCVWYSQIITEKLGVAQFRNYVNIFNYGNKDISGDQGMNNGLTNCWLSSSLSISPKEQLEFLDKLVRNKLPVSADAHVKTKNIMYQETLPGGWDLYGKKGCGVQVDANGHKIQNKQVGWYVGFVRKGKKVITFAYLIADESKHNTFASSRAKKAVTREIIKLIGRRSILKREISLYDESQHRDIPLVVYKDNLLGKKRKIPVAIISHGYGVPNTAYSFIANNLARQGYYVISIQHDLEGDPSLPRTGDIYQKRLPFWKKGLKSLKFVIDTISKDHPELDMSKIVLIGHSNGGDISMMFADIYPDRVKKVISLDSLRYPFPASANILSFRSNDRKPDAGVINTNDKVTVIQIPNARHIDLCDR